jgi:hypothetical protein
MAQTSCKELKELCFEKQDFRSGLNRIEDNESEEESTKPNSTPTGSKHYTAFRIFILCRSRSFYAGLIHSWSDSFYADVILSMQISFISCRSDSFYVGLTHFIQFRIILCRSVLWTVLGIRIRSDPDLFAGSRAGSGNFDRIRIPDPTSLKVLIINQKR